MKFHNIFVKKTSMPNPVRSLGYEYYRTSSPKLIKSSSNSQIQLPKSKTILEITKATNLLFTSFSKTFLTTERRQGGSFWLQTFPPTFLNTGTTDETFQRLLAYASLATSRAFLQQLLACLIFPLDLEHLFC